MAERRNPRDRREELLARESGTIRKEGYFPLEVALVALSPYPVAMTSLGFQTVYRLFNAHPGVRCERVFPPEDGGRWRSLESGRELESFAVLALSLPYEQDLLAVPGVLRAAGLPLRAADRGDQYPLVFCGGPVVSANPEPLAPFVDVCGIGDGELLVPRFCEACCLGLEQDWPRRRLLEELAGRGGLYLPALYEAREAGDSGAEAVAPFPAAAGVPARIERAMAGLEGLPAYSVVVSPETHFRGMFMVEVARGCRWNCRFCLVCRINRPYRHVPADAVIAALEGLPPATGSVGLVGANVFDHPELERILEYLAGRALRLGVSSLRLETVTPELLELVEACGTRSLTLAPEAASDQLLAAIGKRYPPERLAEVVRLIGERGFESLKLYYMIGLPGETTADRRDLAAQARELARLLPGRMRLRISVNPFIPKPQTPWQDQPMLPAGELRTALKELKRELLTSGAKGGARLELSFGPVAESVAQAVLSLGDRRLAGAIEEAAGTGRRLLDCLPGAGIDSAVLLQGRRAGATLHPWRLLEQGQ